MITVRIRGEGERRAEAARVLIPGFEQFELFATPFYDPVAREFGDNHWVITEAQTGTRLGGAHVKCYSSIDEAVESITRWLKVGKITPTKMQLAIERLKRDNTSSVAP